MKLPVKKSFIILLVLFAVLLALFLHINYSSNNNSVVQITESYLRNLPYTSDVNTGIIDSTEAFDNEGCLNISYTLLSKENKENIKHLLITNKKILFLIQNNEPKFDRVLISTETSEGKDFILAIPDCQKINLSKIRTIHDLIDLSIKKYTKIDLNI